VKPVTYENISLRLSEWARVNPDHLAIIDREHRISYSELDTMVRRLASSLKSLGLGRGDLVMTFMPNHYHIVATFLALNRIGAVIVPCVSGCRSEEVAERMGKTPPKAVFCYTAEQAEAVRSVDPGCIIVTPAPEVEGTYCFSALLSGDLHSCVSDADAGMAGDVGLIIYSSGTTGDPKGVQLTFGGIYGSAKEIARRLEARESDVFMMPLPLCHLFGIINGLLTPIYCGGTILLQDRFKAGDCLDLAEREKATVIYGVPTMFIREITEQQLHPRSLVSLRTGVVAGALSSAQLICDIRNVLGFDIMVAYGMTEMIVVSMTDLSDPIEKRANTVGTPYRGVEVKCIGPDGSTLPPGAMGELAARGFPIMKGYYGRPDLTEQVIDADGWMHSGDIVRIDESGYIHICGRIKDIIIRGGRNILPVEIEKLYQDHPDVEQISVVGSPDPDMGEKTVAYVKLRPGSSEDAESIRLYAKKHAVGYKAPDRVVIVDEFPHLANGKLDRKTLKLMAKDIK
jgi:fatty-acyl-CoA synthase